MHFKEVCKTHNIIMKQCKCPGPKSVREVPCPDSKFHNEKVAALEAEGLKKQPITGKSRTFSMKRISDESGVSGIGVVLVGAVFPTGTVVIQWIASDVHSTTIYESIDAFWAIHVASHPGNHTIIKWDDGEIWDQDQMA